MEMVALFGLTMIDFIQSSFSILEEEAEVEENCFNQLLDEIGIIQCLMHLLFRTEEE